MRGPLALLGAALAAVCVSASAAAAPAKLADFQTPDARLSEPGQFGRYVDISRRRQDSVVSPQWQGSPGHSGSGYGLELERGTRAAPQKPAFILLSELPKLPAENEPKHAPVAVGFASLGSAAAGFLMVLAGLTGPLRRLRRGTAVELPAQDPEAAEVEEELAPIQPWGPVDELPRRPLMTVLTDLS